MQELAFRFTQVFSLVLMVQALWGRTEDWGTMSVYGMRRQKETTSTKTRRTRRGVESR